MVLYSLPAFPDKDANAFLKAFARSRGFVQKRGDLDLAGAAKSLLRDWTNNSFPFHTFPPEQPSSTQLVSINALEEIYKKYDSSALDGLQTKASLWAGSGLVKFDPGEVDPREVVLSAVASSDRPIESDIEEGEGGGDFDNDEEEDGSSEGDEDSDEGSAVLSDEEEEAPVPSAKRKRKEQPEPVERDHKTKKVAFARVPSKKDSKPSQPQRKAVQSTKKTPKATDAKKGDTSTPSTGGAKAYDFSKFF